MTASVLSDALFQKPRKFFKRGNMRRIWRIFAIMLLLGLSLGYAFSCSKPNKPVESRGLRLYIKEFWTQNIYVFDPQTKELLDSIKADYSVLMALSPDGQYLFTTHDAPPMPGIQTLRKIQTETMEVVGEMPGIGQLLFLEKGSILLRNGFSVLDYINPFSFQITDSDSIALGRLGFSDTLGFVVGRDSEQRLTLYDFRQKNIIAADSVIIPDGALARSASLALHPSGHRGFGIFYDSYQRAWFIDFTTPDLKIEYAYQLFFHYGHMAVSPDGRYVLFNDPGDVWHSYPEDKFYIYDIISQQMLHVIDIDTLTVLQEYPEAYPGSVGFSPDGANAYFGLKFGPILIYDMQNQQFIDLIRPTFEDWAPISFVVGYEP